MKFVFQAIVFCAAVVLALPSITWAETKSGNVTVTDKPSAEITLGTKVTVKCSFHSAEVFGASGIWVSANVNNVSNDSMYCSCGLAFFDADGKLIACTTQSIDLSPLMPGDKTQLASMSIKVPAAEIAKIKSFQVVWFETPNQADL